MSFEVEIRPSGRRFVVEGHDTLLQAGLKAGINLRYGCSNGNCGKCGARLVSGRIEPVRHSDFRFSERERLEGRFLMCVHAPASDLVIETLEAAEPADIPVQEIETRVKRAELIDEQVLLLHLQTPRSQRLQFLAGQSVVLAHKGLPKAVHPIASCPCDDRNLLFHIPNIPGDAFAEHAFGKGFGRNDRITVRGPKRGDFYLARDRDVARPLLFIAWHTGFAPIQSLIENAFALEVEGAMHLYRLSPTPGRHYLAGQCRAWADAFDNFHYHEWPERFTLLADRTQAGAVLEGISDEIGNITDYAVFVAGPPALTGKARAYFALAGLSPEQLKTEECGLGFFA